ncbi:gene transfer agent family protein [Falsigemmobacter faecalis]|uniref:Gene transfer agent family protein n=1 Tax=Falsigemmobacter faecalis TaxID=2488730 RepID=A0A3P3DU88_9RHOB|nr:gene transfer agent family protein [Falsigemmobacter faecalis]RRH77316.1 gene transfer agent family protein [Falsigemmobacter faecalis]
MANPFAGEVALVVNGEAFACRLTLGSLQGLDRGEGLIALIARFEEGRFGAGDVLAVLLAGLRGAGWQGSAGDLGAAEIGGGLAEALRVAGLLLARAFSLPEGADERASL